MVNNATVDVLIDIWKPTAIKMHSSGDIYCSVRYYDVSMFRDGQYK